MLGSALLMFCLHACKRGYVFGLIWVLLAFSGASGFFLVNIISFLALIVLFKGLERSYPKAKDVMSVTSILAYSVFVDVISYFFIPSYAFGESLGNCVVNGLYFNLRNVFSNWFIFFVVSRLNRDYLVEVVSRLCCKRGVLLHG